MQPTTDTARASSYLNARFVPLTLALICAMATSAWACNIPVFRYALERWRPDVCDVIVFHDAELTPAQRDQLQQLGFPTSATERTASVKVTLSNVRRQADEELNQLWQELSGRESVELPYLVLRNQHRRGPIFAWTGPLSNAQSDHITDSPVRQELSRRLLSGHSIVWLMLKSSDVTKNEQAKTRLERQCELLSKSVTLPEGIGLPGSELFSPVPLFLKFSVLEIDPDDKQEEFLIQLFSAYQPQAIESGEPLLVPVFGRGRALEVIPADGLDEQLIDDLTQFLCAACSCQVKEQNPGFDLLLSVDWEKQLFGDEGEQPPADTNSGNGAARQVPVPLAIPPGRQAK